MKIEFWNALAPHHHLIENSYLDRRATKGILKRIQSPALVVGAGQGLVVAELQQAGLKCDGVDLSTEMIRYAKLRRGLDLIEADARALPFGTFSYKTIIYATGVIDFMSKEDDIRAVLKEGNRILDSSGIILIAFCRL
ncbi:MAG TPA: class I SAM-dependent methyltransferase, partial [Candidatus Dormibacteraeota bacterium]|nr:class I SAM-dependent methyltransferase [Candidatus Dormibacteraeota bacterium]